MCTTARRLAATQVLILAMIALPASAAEASPFHVNFPGALHAHRTASVALSTPRPALTLSAHLQARLRGRWRLLASHPVSKVHVRLRFNAPGPTKALSLRVEVRDRRKLLWRSRVVVVAVINPPRRTGQPTGPGNPNPIGTTPTGSPGNPNPIGTTPTGSWSAPLRLSAGVPSDAGLEQVACPSVSFCATVDDAGGAFTLSGGQWSGPATISPHFLGYVACGSPSMCVAVGSPAGAVPGADAITYSGSAWTTAALPDIPGTSASIHSRATEGPVSCPEPSLCIATFVVFGNQDLSTEFDGSSWSAPIPIPDANGLDALSCPTSTFCAATDAWGNVTTFNGSSWSAPISVDGPGSEYEGGLQSLSCPTMNFCLGVDSRADTVTYNGSSWSSPVPLLPGDYLDSVSCPTATWCMAIGDQGIDSAPSERVGGGPGIAFTYQNGTWGKPVGIDDETNGMEAVSCPTTSFCVATDRNGRVVAYHGT